MEIVLRHLFKDIKHTAGFLSSMLTLACKIMNGKWKNVKLQLLCPTKRIVTAQRNDQANKKMGFASYLTIQRENNKWEYLKMCVICECFHQRRRGHPRACWNPIIPQITQTVDDLVSIYCTWNLYMTQFLHFGQILISALSLKQSPVQLIIITIELQLMIIFSSIDPSVVKQKVQDQHSFIQR